MKRLCSVCCLIVCLSIGCQTPPASTPKAGPSRADTSPRYVIALLDVSLSYHAEPQAEKKLEEVVGALGPGDRFYLIEIGGRFTPDHSVTVQCLMPQFDPEVLEPDVNLSDRRLKQLRLEAIWHKVELDQTAIIKHLQRPAKLQNVTPLFDALDYVATRFGGATGNDKVLLIFSDMIQDSNGLKTPLPPTRAYPMTGLNVSVLFVPWGRGWQSRESAWRKWFITDCDASSFVMLDAAQSQIRELLTPSRVRKIVLAQ